MADLRGDSGAWAAIVRELARYDLSVSSPDDLLPLAERLAAQREEAFGRRKADTIARVAALSAERARIESERGFVAWFLRGSRLAKLTADVQREYWADQQFARQYDWIRARVESLSHSGELAGARAELRVVEWLADLPVGFSVFNDVRLELDRSVRYRGKWMRTAQVDHVILGPNAVFVLETKCWSAEFAASGGYHDPFDQVDRAGSICWRMLADQVAKVRVADVIVATGALPRTPPESKARVLRPSEVRSFVTGYYGSAFAPETRERLDAFFRVRVGS